LNGSKAEEPALQKRQLELYHPSYFKEIKLPAYGKRSAILDQLVDKKLSGERKGSSKESSYYWKERIVRRDSGNQWRRNESLVE